jgi:hypothetical protein
VAPTGNQISFLHEAVNGKLSSPEAEQDEERGDAQDHIDWGCFPLLLSSTDDPFREDWKHW